MTEDDLRAFQDDVQETTDTFIKQIEDLANTKENEIMEV